MVLTQSEIGRITINTPGKMTTHVTVDGVTHIMMPGKQINGMMELIQVIGTLMRAPISDGMNEKAGSATMPHATRLLKEITQHRVLHNKTLT